MATYLPKTRAASFAKYVKIKSAPARLIEIKLSIITASSFTHPSAEALLIIKYSPLT